MQNDRSNSKSLKLIAHLGYFGVSEKPRKCESKKIPPLKSSDIFSQTGIFSLNFTHLLHVPIYAGLQIFIQLPALQLSTDGGHFEHIMVVALNMA